MKNIKSHSKRKTLKSKKHQKNLNSKSKRRTHKQKIKSVNNEISPKKPKFAIEKGEFVMLIGFENIYPEQAAPTLKSLLNGIPREIIIRIVQVLTNLYQGEGLSSMQKFFSPDNQALKEDFSKRFLKFKEKENNTQYYLCALQTSVELLKQAFAIPYKEQEFEEQRFEEKLLKAVLVINDKLMNHKEKTPNKDPYEQMAELMVVNSFSQQDINNFNISNAYREVLPKSVDLFEYVSTDRYFAPIYKRFLEKLQIQHHKEYLVTINTIIALIFGTSNDKKNLTTGTIPPDFKVDGINEFNKNILDYLSMPINKNISLEENEDYKAFRDKPLIKLPNGSYEVINIGFVSDRLFYSLYFDFQTIAKELGLSDFENKYKESFMEKTLLCKYLEMVNENKRYTAMSSKDIKIQYPKESGEPDYYLKTKKNTVILFENKEIMIKGAVKEAREFDKIIAEYKNKLLLKTYNDKGEIKTPKPEGIGQLIEQIKKIQNGKAFWDTDVAQNSTIYPVLVIGDARLLPNGLPYLMQEWYENRCKSENINEQNIKPLIVLSPTTLLFYAQEFKNNGLECYFEAYYEHRESAKKHYTGNMLVDTINVFISFSDFIENLYPKKLNDTFNLYKDKAFPSKENI